MFSRPSALARRLVAAASSSTAAPSIARAAAASGVLESSSSSSSAPSRLASSRSLALANALNKPLKETDPELFDIVEHEKARQRDSLVLIASENFAPAAVAEALGSCLSNKYSEGFPGQRYYGGNEWIDKAEILCQKRALEAFGLDEKEWGVCVQPLSGSPANLAAFTALLAPHDRILSLELSSGGHLSHGYATPAGKKLSATSLFWETAHYRASPDTGLVDPNAVQTAADIFRPKLIVCGASAYSRLVDYASFRATADSVGALLLADMAHVSGLVAGKAIPSPFPHCDIVTTTTHKSLRGPRGAMIFFRRGIRKPAVPADPAKGTKGTPAEHWDLEGKINAAVFPGIQGGPHNHTIAALATALKQASSPEFREYAGAVVANSKAFADCLVKDHGFTLVSGGTDNHLVLVDLRPQGLDGARVERICELAGLALNKNTVPGDKSALIPSGIRMGSPALTSRGFDAEDFKKVAGFFARVVEITKRHKAACEAKGLKKVAEFKSSLPDAPFASASGEKAPAMPAEWPSGLAELRADVAAFARGFPVIGFDAKGMRY